MRKSRNGKRARKSSRHPAMWSFQNSERRLRKDFGSLAFRLTAGFGGPEDTSTIHFRLHGIFPKARKNDASSSPAPF
jgi:hypothetical protein